MNAADGKRQRPQPLNSVHCYCCPYARTVGVDNHTSRDAGIVDDGHHNNGYEYVGDDDVQWAAADVDDVRRQYVGDKRSRSHGHGDLPVGAVRNDRSTATLSEVADRKPLPRRQRSGQSEVHHAIDQAMPNGVVSPVIDNLAFAPSLDNYGQRKRMSGTIADVSRDAYRRNATETTMENSRSGATMLMEARVDARGALSAQHVDGQNGIVIGRGDIGGRIASTALSRRPERCVTVHKQLKLLIIFVSYVGRIRL